MDGILVGCNGRLGSSANLFISFLSTRNPISMENTEQVDLVQPQKRPKGLKTSTVRSLSRAGKSQGEIADMLGVTVGTISYHLKKKRKYTSSAEVKSQAAVSVNPGFEVNIYGVEIKLQHRPTSIEQRENAIIIS